MRDHQKIIPKTYYQIDKDSKFKKNLGDRELTRIENNRVLHQIDNIIVIDD